MVSAQAASNGTKTAAADAAAIRAAANELNEQFYNYVFIILGALTMGMIIWRVTLESVKYMRTLVCLSNDTQRYFAVPSPSWASFKKNLLYAPIFRKRHNREFKLSAAVNVGTLPTRFQLLFLSAYFGTNVAFCVVSITWDQSYSVVAKQVRNRSGILAVVNMIPLFIMATRNNPLITWLNMSFDTFNLLHRWFGRIVVLEALAHTLAHLLDSANSRGWAAAITSVTTPGSMVFYGFIGTIAFVIMALQAMSILRHAFYETFKYMHIALAIVVLVVLYFHLKEQDQVTLIYVCIAIWALERINRVAKVVYRNIGKGGSRTLVEALPGNACRITIDMARPWAFKPGQHAYLYMPSVGLLTSHPFSVAWSEESEKPDLSDEKLAMNRNDVLAMQKTTMSFIVRGRTGFTDTLFRKAEASADGKFYTKCYAEGPYGGMHMMHSYGTVMLFAGGVGITHQVPHVRDLVARYANGTVAARKVILVWIIQSPEHLEWIRPWMTSILAMEKRRDVLRIMLFVSRPRSTKEIHSPSATVQMFPGRPNIPTLIDMEMENQVGAMGVSVCGSGGLSDDVRRAVRDRQHAGNIDFVEEAFSW
ncbi:ferric reductase like transmembrane component-domain-containing protein [Bisporella sp. PMI_857]|nr:ferric reductase like transmembrane component-domain-containing protein [Bisporella sp. PMI_857]